MCVHGVCLSLAIRAIILSVLPRPISSAKIPPRHTGGIDDCSSSVTELTKLLSRIRKSDVKAERHVHLRIADTTDSRLPYAIVLFGHSEAHLSSLEEC